MTRKDFLNNIITLGAGAPFMATLFASCRSENIFFEDIKPNFKGKVLVIGAGAAGMIAGHILRKQNIDFEILEASSVYGGRMKKLEGFADFPIDLGAEWIHTDPSILAKLLDEPDKEVEVEIINYNPQTIYFWKKDKLRKRNFYSNFYSEYKFKSTTWFDFFEQHIVPGIQDKITYNSPVREINYAGEKVQVRNINNDVFEADRVLVTVPISILQQNFIDFQPALPNEKIEALGDVYMPPIFKVFIEFSERFYPDVIHLGGLGEFLGSEDSNLFYDVAFRKDSSRNILGLFTIGERAAQYASMNSEGEIIKSIMADLDKMYDGKATKTYIKHYVQDWNKEPYIQGSYSHYQSNFNRNIEILRAPLNNKVYFAGEALTLDSDTATVHGAGESSYEVLREMLKN